MLYYELTAIPFVNGYFVGSGTNSRLHCFIQQMPQADCGCGGEAQGLIIKPICIHQLTFASSKMPCCVGLLGSTSSVLPWIHVSNIVRLDLNNKNTSAADVYVVLWTNSSRLHQPLFRQGYTIMGWLILVGNIILWGRKISCYVMDCHKAITYYMELSHDQAINSKKCVIYVCQEVGLLCLQRVHNQKRNMGVIHQIKCSLKGHVFQSSSK